MIDITVVKEQDGLRLVERAPLVYWLNTNISENRYRHRPGTSVCRWNGRRRCVYSEFWTLATLRRKRKTKKEESKMGAMGGYILWWNFRQTGRRGESVRTNRRLERGTIPLFWSFLRLLPPDFSLAKLIACRIQQGQGETRDIYIRKRWKRAVFGEGGNTLRTTEKYINIYKYKYI